MARRPKASTVGLWSGAIDTYTALNVRNMKKNYASLIETQRNMIGLQREQIELSKIGFTATLGALSNVRDLTVASMGMIVELDEKLQELSNNQWEIAQHFERIEQREKFHAEMRYSVFLANQALDRIEIYSEDFPAYAFYQVEELEKIVEQRDVRAVHFSYVSTDEMNNAQNMLNRLERIKSELILRLGD